MGGGESSARINSVTQLSKSASLYTSSKLNDTGNILLGGENGLYFSSLSNTNNANIQKASSLGFKIPLFSLTNNSINSAATALNKAPAASDVNSTKIKIYSICNANNALYIGGYFSYVNGEEKNNIVKLSANGVVDNNFIGSVEGTVYKILDLDDTNLLVAGAFGGFNGGIAHSIAKINSNGLFDETFKPFNEYMLAKINDIALLPNKQIMVAGVFIKDTENADQNSSMEEIIQKTKTIVVLNQDGTLDEEYTNKFSDIKHEAFAIDIYGDSIYIGGDFKFSKDNQFYNNLVSYSIDGQLNTSFQIGKLSGVVFDVKADSNKVIYAGDFIMDDALHTRSFYIADLLGQTIMVNNFTVDSDIYSIEIYDGTIVLTGEGNFNLNGEAYNNNISLQLDN